VASLLLAGEDQEWSISRGGLWWLKRRRRGESFHIKLKTVINPNLLEL
jgi:hypothetical protein